MKTINHEWDLGMKNGYPTSGIPSIENIKRTALSFLKEAYDNDGLFSSGGLTAYWEDEDTMCLEYTCVSICR
jgi:hypothetical protein